MKKSKKIVLSIIITLLVIIVAILACAWSVFKTQFKAMNTIKKLDNNFYFLEYKGDYGFDEYIKSGGGNSDEKMAEYISSFLSHGFYKPTFSKNNYGCSAISATSTNGNLLFGRNFDWKSCTAMIVITRPDNGYASISTSNLDFLGFEENFLPEGMKNKMMSLAAVYVPLDGMNEKGLCIADLIIEDGTETHQNSGKPSITTTAAIRLLLDKCANVNEAIEELNKYDMNSSAGMQHHFAISDANGKSIVAEYIDNTLYVTDTKVVTNFYLTEGNHYGIGTEQSKLRYNFMLKNLETSNGTLTQNQLTDLLKAISKHNYPEGDETTEWSIIFDTENLSATYYRKENFDKNYTFNISN